MRSIDSRKCTFELSHDDFMERFSTIFQVRLKRIPDQNTNPSTLLSFHLPPESEGESEPKSEQICTPFWRPHPHAASHPSMVDAPPSSSSNFPADRRPLLERLRAASSTKRPAPDHSLSWWRCSSFGHARCPGHSLSWWRCSVFGQAQQMMVPPAAGSHLGSPFLGPCALWSSELEDAAVLR